MPEYDTTYGDLAAILGAGTLLGGTIGAGLSGPQTRPTSTGVSSQIFPQAARDVFYGAELPTIAQTMSEQRNLLTPFLQGFDMRPFLGQQYGGAGRIARGAQTTAAQQQGFTDFGPLSVQDYEGLQGLSPQLMAALRQLVMQRGAKVQSVIPPGYASFFAPAGKQVSERLPEPVSPFNTGFGLGQGISQLAGLLV